MNLKQSRLIFARGKAVGKFGSIIGLNTFNWEREGIDKVLKKHGGGIGIVFFKGLDKAPSRVLVDSSVLKELFADDLAVDEAGGGNKLNVDLKALTGISHLLIGFRDILRVGRFKSVSALFTKKSI